MMLTVHGNSKDEAIAWMSAELARLRKELLDCGQRLRRVERERDDLVKLTRVYADGWAAALAEAAGLRALVGGPKAVPAAPGAEGPGRNDEYYEDVGQGA